LEEKRAILKEEGEKFKKDNGLNMFFESSAKTGYNAREIFIQATKLLYSQYLGYKEKRISTKYSMINEYENNITFVSSSMKKYDKDSKEIEIDVPKSESRCC